MILRVEGPLGFSLDLPHIPGKTHTIRIDNSCPEGVGAAKVEGTDFSFYFSVVNLDEGGKFDLATDEGPLGSDAVCNTGYLGSRTSLLPVS